MFSNSCLEQWRNPIYGLMECNIIVSIPRKNTVINSYGVLSAHSEWGSGLVSHAGFWLLSMCFCLIWNAAQSCNGDRLFLLHKHFHCVSLMDVVLSTHPFTFTRSVITSYIWLFVALLLPALWLYWTIWIMSSLQAASWRSNVQVINHLPAHLIAMSATQHFFFSKAGYYLNVVHVIITSHVEAPGNSKHPGAALSAIFMCLRWTRIDSYVCVLCECLYLCVCVINAIAEHVVVNSSVIARLAMLLWLCAGLWPPGRALPTSPP